MCGREKPGRILPRFGGENPRFCKFGKFHPHERGRWQHPGTDCDRVASNFRHSWQDCVRPFRHNPKCEALQRYYCRVQHNSTPLLARAEQFTASLHAMGSIPLQHVGQRRLHLPGFSPSQQTSFFLPVSIQGSAPRGSATRCQAVADKSYKVEEAQTYLEETFWLERPEGPRRGFDQSALDRAGDAPEGAHLVDMNHFAMVGLWGGPCWQLCL